MRHLKIISADLTAAVEEGAVFGSLDVDYAGSLVGAHYTSLHDAEVKLTWRV